MPRRPAMYNTPAIRNGGFGALQVEAITNRPLSIARRHMAASQLRMRDIEPDELSSSEWVRFLVMEERERDRWMLDFVRRRRGSDASQASSSSSAGGDRNPLEHTRMDKAEEARMEERRAWEEEHETAMAAAAAAVASSGSSPVGSTPLVSLYARGFDAREETGSYSPRRPMHARRAVTEGLIDAPPAYEPTRRSGTPPPAYERH